MDTLPGEKMTTKDELLEQYFTRSFDGRGRVLFTRKSDGFIVEGYNMSFYGYNDIESIGKGEFTPQLLRD